MTKKKHFHPRRWLAALCMISVLSSAALHLNRNPSDADSSAGPTSETPAPVLPTPSPVPTPLPSPEPTAQADLPVLRRGNTDRKRIAITVDDCYQTDNLAKIADWTVAEGGKLTLFPIGENVVRRDMARLLRRCVFDYGFEIENHTWSHARIFRLSEEEMASEIWKQQEAVNDILGVDYRQRFFRLMGGDGEHDQRTHSYLRQLGYEGVAGWSLSGSDAPLSDIRRSLAPGMIYLFHTTDEDTEKLRRFIPYAVSQGYELVTLSELMELAPNAMAELTPTPTPMPAPEPYVPDFREVKSGDYAWIVTCLQRALAHLGYLTEAAQTATQGNPADGVFGESTARAVSLFQRDHGLTQTGAADAETQRLLLDKAVVFP